MIVISLALVIGAAVSLFIGLFVVTDTLTFIFGAIVLCLVSLFLLWLGTRSRTATAPAAPSAPVYGGAARAGGSSAPARPSRRDTDLDELDDLTSPDSDTVVRKTTARDRAATRVAVAAGDASSDSPDATPSEEPATAPASVTDQPVRDGAPTVDDPTPAAAAGQATTTAPVKKSTARKATARKATAKKATAKKATAKKAAAKKSTTRKAATKKAAAGGTGTTGAAARRRLAEISGVGPAKQDALLAHYGSLESIQQASVDDIVANVKGFGTALATRVKDELA